MVLGPQLCKSAFKQMRILPIDDERALVVLITDTGYIKNRVIQLPKALNERELNEIVAYLNKNLAGETITSLTFTHLRQLRHDLYERIDILEQMLSMLEESDAEGESRVFIGGASNILDQPEFRDMNKVKHLLSLFEQGERLVLMLDTNVDGLSVRIGTENKLAEMNDCSLITASYYLRERPVGTIGVLGPTRMEYARVITIIKEIANRLNRLVELL